VLRPISASPKLAYNILKPLEPLSAPETELADYGISQRPDKRRAPNSFSPPKKLQDVQWPNSTGD
jgi:hypothetical protein